MFNIQHATGYSEGIITQAVFNAARGNPTRKPTCVGGLGQHTFYVTFFDMDTPDGECKAVVKDTNGFEVGNAIVDKTDI